MITEALSFRDLIEENRQYAAGLHIEVAATDVTACAGGSAKSEDDLLRHCSSLCDPRLNADQAEGVAHLDGDAPSKSSVELTVQARSIQTGNRQRDDHLRSNDSPDESTFEVAGDLTIRGVTKPVIVGSPAGVCLA